MCSEGTITCLGACKNNQYETYCFYMETISSYMPELLAFHQVAELGGFSQAADKLNLSKSQLSKQVARLETLLRVPLFHRTTRKVSLTQEGKQLLNYSYQIFQLSHEAAVGMKELRESEGGLIRLTAPSSLGDWFAPELLSILQAQHPLLKVEIDLSNAKRDLIKDEFDFALRAMDESNPDLIARYVGHLKDVIVASPLFLKQHKFKAQDPKDLHQLPCVLNSHQGKWNSWKLQRGQKDVVVEVQGQFACSSYATTRLLCMQGIGAARMPYYLVKQDLEEGRLVRLFPEYSIATHPLYLVYASKGDKLKRRRLFKDVLLNWLKTQKDVFQTA